MSLTFPQKTKNGGCGWPSRHGVTAPLGAYTTPLRCALRNFAITSNSWCQPLTHVIYNKRSYFTIVISSYNNHH